MTGLPFNGNAACRIPNLTVKLGWIGVYGSISVFTVGTGWTTGGTVLVCTVGGRLSITLSTLVGLLPQAAVACEKVASCPELGQTLAAQT